MESLLRDLKFSARSLFKHWGFTAIAVITLAIGIGATTTIFSVVNGILLRPLPGVSSSDRLADVYATEANGSSFHTFSYPDYLYYRDQNKVFDGLMAYTGVPLNLNAGAQPERIFGIMVSGNYFDVLGTRPALGRFFLPEEDQTPATMIGGTLGTIGLVLAAIGIFGLVSYSVSQRTREVGIRMALGAQKRDVLSLVMRQGLWLALAGVGIGWVLSFVLTRALGSLLYGVGSTDPLVFIGTALLLMGVAFVASYQPARRATRIDPLAALRYE